MTCPFYSRRSEHKSVFGAVAEGQNLRLRLFLPYNCHSPYFILKPDNNSDGVFSSESEQYFPMEYYGEEEDGSKWWKIDWKTKKAGLYFYRFSYEAPDGTHYLYKGKYDNAINAKNGDFWQETVYKADYNTPLWLSGGIIYQIFPDRFCFSGNAKEGVPAERFLREEWAGQPFFEDNETPQRINNDYWQGDLQGIISRLDYLKELNVTAIYLNPVFEAHSNHRYNTADYEKIDPMLGSEEDFSLLCREAKKRGMHIILDGVFSHTGADSRYFNLYGRYGDSGAVRDENSPFKNWYTFNHWPDDYKCWWNVKSLPETKENNEEFLEFITGREGIARRWLRNGADGWRLDVADELPDEFLDRFNSAVKSEKKDAVILGEVWEDASNKQSYGRRRRYLQGGQLDSVMNYIFRNGIVKFLCGGNADELMECVLSVLENYPKPSVDVLMNLLGTHDTERILTALCKKDVKSMSRKEQAGLKLTQEERERGIKFVKLAATLQYTLPGVPSVYYGDETGMEGGCDPFNRAPYDYENQNCGLFEFYKKLGRIRTENRCFVGGEFIPVKAELGYISYMRKSGGSRVFITVNRWCDAAVLPLPREFEKYEVLLGASPENGLLKVAGESAAIIKGL